MARRCRRGRIPVGVCIGRRNSCALWPCARGPVRVPELGGRSWSSTSFVGRRPTRALPSSRDGRKTGRTIFFSCVTTQAPVCGLVWCLSSAVRHRLYVAVGVCARPLRARDDAPPVRAGVAGVWRLASGARVADNPDAGSSAGCFAWGETGADSPCAGSGAPGAFWRAALARPGLHRLIDVVLFPREVLLPGDRSGRNANSSLGTLPVFTEGHNPGPSLQTQSPAPRHLLSPAKAQRAGDFEVDPNQSSAFSDLSKAGQRRSKRPTAK